MRYWKIVDRAGDRGHGAAAELPQTVPRPAIVERLRDHGDRPAVSVGESWLTYRELAELAERTARALGAGRRLVLVETANDVASLVGYLGALYGGHVVLLVDRADRVQVAALMERFDPDVVIGADGTVQERRPGSRHRLHAELALLLATSGSTGSPRLVRLSASAVDANAAAIATYLRITATDRAALTLPMHYCYGLSVINSNLLAGAGVLLSAASVLDTAFWAAAREHAVTSLHGVPHTFALLDRVGFADMALPHLRYVTQAGGRLPPGQVRRWAHVGARRGWRLYVMYGQTEATARMAYLPPELAAVRPGAIGIAVPGGSLTVEPVDEETADGVGELVYRGPNVMLGYADSSADLAEGRAVQALRTGDLGRQRPDGLFEIVGRRSRFVKPFGIRTDLDGLERLLADHGIEAACAGTDARIVVACTPAGGRADGDDDRDVVARVRTIVTGRLALPPSIVSVVVVPTLPRRPNGKLDHPAVARLGQERAGKATPRRPARPLTLRGVFARTFPGLDLYDDASFVDLGGDSLTYVQIAADIERVLGVLPPGWEHRPLGELESMAARDPASRRSSATTATHRHGWAGIETAVLLRALAIIFVVGEHAHSWAIVGGAHLLLALSGWTFARFVLSGDASAERRNAASTPVRILRSTTRIALPSATWIAFRALLHDVRFVDIVLVGSLRPPLVPGYWFVDALVQILLLLALLFALPALRHLERRHPFGFAAAVLSLALAGRLYPSAYGWWFSVDLYSTQVVLWLFVLGWMAHRAVSTPQRCTTIVATLVLVPTFFGADALRSVIVVGGLLLLLLRPTVRVPRVVVSVATRIAAASLGIYLTHFGVLPLSSLGLPPAAVVAVALAVGISSTWVLDLLLRQLARRRRNRATSTVSSQRGGTGKSGRLDHHVNAAEN